MYINRYKCVEKNCWVDPVLLCKLYFKIFWVLSGKQQTFKWYQSKVRSLLTT
jgi:hypothetical protein